MQLWLIGGLLLILLYSWRDAVVRGARISRANPIRMIRAGVI